MIMKENSLNLGSCYCVFGENERSHRHVCEGIGIRKAECICIHRLSNFSES